MGGWSTSLSSFKLFIVLTLRGPEDVVKLFTGILELALGSSAREGFTWKAGLSLWGASLVLGTMMDFT